MGYEFDDTTTLGSVPDGSAVLVTGPDRATRRTAMGLLAPAHDRGEAVVLVSTTGGPAATANALGSAGGRLDPGWLAIIDCTGVSSPEPYVASVSTPADLAGVSAKLADRVARLEADRVRVGVASLTAVLCHADLDRVIRFVNALRGRVGEEAGLLVCTLDPSVDDGSGPPVRQLFDHTLALE
jgi:hypothetical protein